MKVRVTVPAGLDIDREALAASIRAALSGKQFQYGIDCSSASAMQKSLVRARQMQRATDEELRRIPADRLAEWWAFSDRTFPVIAEAIAPTGLKPFFKGLRRQLAPEPEGWRNDPPLDYHAASDDEIHHDLFGFYPEPEPTPAPRRAGRPGKPGQPRLFLHV
jgi:hypothetical protein